jgi:effector-binding domain-containing protein
MNYEVQLRRLEETNTAVVRTRVSLSDIGAVMPEIFKEVYEYLELNQIPLLGQAFGCYVIHQQENQVEIEAGFTTAVPIQSAGRIQPGTLPEGEAAVCLHVGPYEEIGPAYDTIVKWIREQGRQQAGPPWEVYLSMPAETPAQTEVYFPLAKSASQSG